MLLKRLEEEEGEEEEAGESSVLCRGSHLIGGHLDSASLLWCIAGVSISNCISQLYIL